MAGGTDRPAPKITDHPKGLCVMKILRYLPLLVLAWASTAAAEDDRQAVPQAEARREIEGILARPAIGLADLFRIAELANPDLAVARIEVQARTGRMRQAGLYPNPELSFEVEEMSVDDPSFNKQKVEFSQAFLIGGRRGAAVNAARAEVDQAGELAVLARRNALGRVHKWWADQIHFREVEEAFEEMMAEAERTLAVARIRFEAKAAPESHVARAMLEVYDLEVARQGFERERVRSAAEMKVILGGVEVPTDRLIGSLDPDAEGASLRSDTAAEMGDHPALRAARLGVDAAEAMLVTAKKERIPDLNLFVAYGRARPIEVNFVEGGISFPLPIFHRNQGRVTETASLVAMARHEERIAAHELEVVLSTAWSTHHTAHEQMDQLTERIAPAAERALIQAQEAYRSGRLMFLELVDAQRTFNDVLLRTMELRRDLALAEADLMSLLGAGPYADIGEE
jgi:cobalt-zinc-cadmium efflux system outer membrane protein